MALQADKRERIQLPGFGLPLTDMPPQSERFPNAIADWCGSSGVTTYERRMLALMNSITDKPAWENKVFNDEIVEKWWKEADALNRENDPMQSPDDDSSDDDNRGGGRTHADYMHRDMFDFCMAELRDKSTRFKETGMVAVIDTEATIVKSDRAVSAELRERLMEAVKALEDVPEERKDWHPGSGDLVLDLVHPSLWPLVYGKTRVLPYGKTSLDNIFGNAYESELTEAIPGDRVMTKRRTSDKFHEHETSEVAAWDKFQWLPSDIHFRQDGSAQITSYINNLHPAQHKELYGVLEKMVDAAIPLWNDSLSWFHDRTRIRIESSGGDDDWERPPGAKSPVWDRPADWDDDEDGDRMDDDEYREIWHDWMRDVRLLKAPEIDPYKPCDRARIDLRQKFPEQGLQIIFKLANIHLTPDKPTYEGGTWHVEGALNEHICATALYYYDQDNITESELSFRQAIGMGELCLKPPQSEFESVEIYYDVANEDEPLIQVLGSVATKQDRLLVFPNVLHHRVSSFSLADETKPGHRKILAMFLVDPHIRIISTANVPPQRRDWWEEEARKTRVEEVLPPELYERVMGFVDNAWGWHEAERLRDELMAQRGRMNDETNDQMENATVSFCEH